jgi:hypothetical protein
MSRTWSKAVVFAIAVVFAAAPFVFAQTSGTGSATSGTQPQMGTGTTTGSQPSSQMGTMAAQDTLQATVADVNHQHNTLKLKMQGGETVEFKLPEASLANLNKGDSVQVSIRKADAHSSGMGTSTGTTPSRPESGSPGSTTSGSAPKSR